MTAAPTEAAGLGWIDSYFNITDNFWGNGCQHGFKPAKSCPNEHCEERQAHIAWENAVKPEREAEARIVAWLRKTAKDADSEALGLANQGDTWLYDLTAHSARCRRSIADAIERGEHREGGDRG